jgi:hypothetical protein
MNGFMSSAAHFKEGEEPKEEAVVFFLKGESLD